MTDLNLFGSEGFQEPVALQQVKSRTTKMELARVEEPEKKTVKETVKKSPEPNRKSKYKGHEIFSFLLSAAIVALVIWYFVLRKEVSFYINEYQPSAFEIHRQDTHG